MDAVGVVFLLVIVVAVVVVCLKILARTIGCNCHGCGKRMAFFDELSSEDQVEILHYFETYEDRTPDTSGMFVCKDCLFVYDDFSGEKKSMSGDCRAVCKICNGFVEYMAMHVALGELPRFRKANPELVEKGVECLACRRRPFWDAACMSCDTPLRLFGCRTCYTVYAWLHMAGSKYKFFVPLSSKTILKEAYDPTWGNL